MLAMTFLQLGAMQRGMLPKEEALEDEFREKLTSNAVAAGETLLALRRWRELANLFPATPEGRLASARIAALEKEPAIAEEWRLEAQYEKASRDLSAMARDARYRDELARHLNRLKVAPPAEQRLIRCLLGIPVQNYQIALGEAYQKQSWGQVLAIATSLAALDDREGWPCIYAAAAQVQLGKPEEALPHLRAALLRGYRKPERIRALGELKSLHGQAGFEAILKEMEAEVRPLP